MTGRKLADFSERYDPLVRAQTDKAALQRRLEDLEAVVAKDSVLAKLYAKVSEQQRPPPEWLRKAPPKRAKSPVIATAFLSDTHFDEVVDPRQINGVNAYDRDIAERRLRTFFEKTILLCDTYLNFHIEGLVLPLGGDMVSGNIHEELAETNESRILETCLHWSEQLQAGINLLAKHFPKVHIPAVPGNHGRLSKKPRAKGRVQDNFDWLIYKILQMRAPKGVTFQVGLDPDVRYSVYDHRYQLTHGDQFRGGSGWGGIASPILRGDQRKRVREEATRTPYDTLLMGHWHQLKDFGKVIINGSLKGYDEYAALENMEFERPQQAFWLTAPHHGRILTCPIFVADGETPAAVKVAA